MHSCRRAFTLVELMMVVAVLVLLIAMLVPSMSAALEQSRIVSCGSVLHHIANALEQYVTENNNHFPYNAANNDFRTMIGQYLGLSQYMVPCYSGQYRGTSYTVRWDSLKPFQCPSGAGLGSNAEADGREGVQGYWLNNWYVSQNPLNNYYPNLQRAWQAFDNNNDWNNWYLGGPSHIGLLCEEWQVDGVNATRDPKLPMDPANNPTYSVVGAGFAQPYSTHYRYGPLGVMGIGRNILYGDWHIKFRKCTYTASTDCVQDASYWSDQSASAVQIPCTQIDRGNEVGQSFQIQTRTGATFWGWRPILQDPDIAYWWGS